MRPLYLRRLSLEEWIEEMSERLRRLGCSAEYVLAFRIQARDAAELALELGQPRIR